MKLIHDRYLEVVPPYLSSQFPPATTDKLEEFFALSMYDLILLNACSEKTQNKTN